MIDSHIRLPGWFEEPGAYVLVDGQFGSTGKGLMAGWLAEYGGEKITHVTTNAGPNSGHTAYYDRFEAPLTGNTSEELKDYQKIVTQQIPVASVFLNRMGHKPLTLLNAGAVIDMQILQREVADYRMPVSRTLIHPAAAVITSKDIYDDHTTTARISGTGKGIGPAMARKVLRDGASYAYDTYRPMLPEDFRQDRSWDQFWDWNKDVVFVETAQGFSLGLNSSRFFPYTTARECTVMQAISDARIPARRVKKVISCFRTFPIRVGSVEGTTSGHWYEDQREMTWDEIGVEPELTTVTKRVRRVASWSRTQFRESIAANEPDVIFLNFCNYLGAPTLMVLVEQILEDYKATLGRPLPVGSLLGGGGPYSHDIRKLT